MIRPLAAVLVPVVAAAACTAWQPGGGGEQLAPVRDAGSQAISGAVAAPVPAGDAAHAAKAVEAAKSAAGRRTASRGASRSAGASTAVATADAPATTLRVSIDSLTPGVVPVSSPVVVTGRISNRTGETWEGINVYACTSRSPITSAHELEHAAEEPGNATVCGRTEVFETIDRLGPGKSRAYRLEVARDKLGIGTAPGVYWFSVQVLGTSPKGRDSAPDGSARTFLPQAGSAPADARISMVLPLRRSALHTPDGRLSDEEGWVADLAPGGRLANLVGLAEAAPPGTVSLLADPAVIDAARQIAAGNPPRSLGPTEDEPESTVNVVGRSAAGVWVERFVALAKTQEVLGLPYGDLDVAAAARTEPTLIDRALAQSRSFFDGLGVDADPVVAPPSGLLSQAALARVHGATVLLSDRALPAEYAERSTVPGMVTDHDTRIRIWSASVAAGGPGPTHGLRALALRQRILAEAGVRALAWDTRPLLVMPSAEMNPGPTPQDFFDELDRGFLDLTTSLEGQGPEPEVGGVDYPAEERDQEQDPVTLDSADRLVQLGSTLDRMLPDDNSVAKTAAREALAAASYSTRTPELGAGPSVGAAAAWFSARLAEVDVEVPKFVILSSGRGPFAMTITNDLDQPVRLKVTARTDDALHIFGPVKAIDVPAASSRTVNLTAQSEVIGVYPVVLVITDEAGRQVQQSQEISIRINKVGRALWVIMGGGVALLLIAIVIRLRLRRRSSRPTADAPADGPAADEDVTG